MEGTAFESEGIDAVFHLFWVLGAYLLHPAFLVRGGLAPHCSAGESRSALHPANFMDCRAGAGAVEFSRPIYRTVVTPGSLWGMVNWGFSRVAGGVHLRILYLPGS